MRPLRRAREFRALLGDIDGGAHSLAEVDGAFHDDVLQATDDRRRHRRLTTPGRLVVACSAYEIRHEPWEVMEDLIALGVPRLR